MTTTAPTPVTLRRITALALPALVVLAAEPVYVLVDTAVVGHLGRVPLAALAIGGGVMSAAAFLGNVLAYGGTGRAARHFGAGDRGAAVAEGVQATWLALAGGVLLAAFVQIFAGPITRALAGNGPDSAVIAAESETWLRVAILGAPFILIALSGQGWMRGIQETRKPMYIVMGANLLSAALVPLLVYPLGLGLVGSAIANVAAQAVSGVFFIRALLAEKVPLGPDFGRLRRQLSTSRDLIVRGVAFQVCFLSAATVAARFGAASLAAHQIGLQLWMFCAFALDAVAIAAQALIGADLGASDAERARATARKVGWMGVVSGGALALVIGVGVFFLPGLFTSDQAVHEQAYVLWPWFVAMMPAAGLVFALDGVFIGAGDITFLRNQIVLAATGFLPLIWLAYLLDLGLAGVWAGLTLFIAIRLVTLLLRLRGGRWAVTGTAA
ncbi:MATE family efflux transporter [Phytomonospora endophytica]|uniref:Putative MATE family efflux protein n=1 Tax=Phytomonospora endophytica TaxID=714109 RepID=A0A841FHI1_9ACTN|nr:MATE family efflux transporter [Phytomonospora endophytica]MBB6032547.1 putative MATE family efflux protein [Phytomonospora endophytica]GIG66303.1 putative DNA-damage-inducible protein F [Phytomonospora endophytica]